VDGTASISDTLYVENTFTVASGSNIHSGTLYVDAATDYVGIGTTDPGAKLVISEGVTNVETQITDGSIDFTRSSDGTAVGHLDVTETGDGIMTLSYDGVGSTAYIQIIGRGG